MSPTNPPPEPVPDNLEAKWLDYQAVLKSEGLDLEGFSAMTIYLKRTFMWGACCGLDLIIRHGKSFEQSILESQEASDPKHFVIPPPCS